MEEREGLTKKTDMLKYCRIVHCIRKYRMFLFIFWDIELITLYAILGTQSEGILVLAFERDHWDTP